MCEGPVGRTLVKYLQTNCRQNIYEKKRKRNGEKSKPMKLPVLKEDVVPSAVDVSLNVGTADVKLSWLYVYA